MKLQLIGTGSITAPQTSASALIDDSILVDCGTGVVKELMKQKLISLILIRFLSLIYMLIIF